MKILQLDNVTKKFGGLTAVNDVSFSIDAGAISAIIGPNGAGKTTLFNLISGFLAPTSGTVVFEGQAITNLPVAVVAARGLVRTFQLVQLFPELTALGNVRVGAHLQSTGGVWSALMRGRRARAQAAAVDADARELLAFVGLGNRTEVLATELTYGQQRLLEVARALATRPKLLLLDEPAAGLNREETDHLAKVIGEIVKRKITVLIIEHDMSLVMKIASKVIVVDFGKKIAEGTPAEVQQDPDVLDAYLGGSTVLDPVFLAQTLVSGIGIGCVFGLIGIGYCVIYNASGIVNFAQGAFVMLGGMLTHALLTRAGLPLFVAAIISISLVAGLGVLVERFVVRPLWHRNATPFVMILATLAVQIVLERATLLVAGDQPKTLPNFIDLPPLMLGKVAISYQLMVIAVTSMVLVGLLALFFAQTRVGRAMRACSINREAAALQGIPVSRMLAYAFALSAGLGAIAGVLITPTQFTAFNIGVSFAISGFIAAIVGGFGNPGGAFVGGILLGVAQAIAIVTLGSGFKNIAALSILLVFITIRPTGLFGKPGNAK